jgi:hypothetical protein
MSSPAAGVPQAPTAPAASRDVPIDLLRTCVVLLVVLHHAAMAYHPYAPPQERLGAPSMAWTAFPIVDGRRCPGVEVLVAFDDLFFMSLLFLVSGVFVWPSLVRKGTGHFIRDRALRLGLPFVVAAAVLGPLAYYPTYLVSDPAPHLAGFWRDWRALGFWPAGPVWFLWVLLLFDVLAAAIYSIAPGFGPGLGRLSGQAASRPVVFAGAVMAASALAYVPLAMIFTAGSWLRAGPFTFQLSRILHYAVYFIAGMGLGAHGVGRGLLPAAGALARGWASWIGPALAAFALSAAVLLASLAAMPRGGPGPALSLLGAAAFVLSCATISFAWLAVFLRLADTRSPVSDSLRANAYGIFIFHLACVSWLQLLLLHAPLPSGVKLGLVFAGAVTVSWGMAAGLRRIRAVAAVL